MFPLPSFSFYFITSSPLHLSRINVLLGWIDKMKLFTVEQAKIMLTFMYICTLSFPACNNLAEFYIWILLPTLSFTYMTEEFIVSIKLFEIILNKIAFIEWGKLHKPTRRQSLTDIDTTMYVSIFCAHFIEFVWIYILTRKHIFLKLLLRFSDFVYVYMETNSKSTK